MSKKLIEIASEIIQTQVALSPMSAQEIVTSLRQVFCTLQDLQKAETGQTELSEAQETGLSEAKAIEPMSPKDSVQENKVICLECGAEMRQLTIKHLSSHNMNLKEYKKKYGFTIKTPLSAKSLTKARSKAAKKRGLPENLKKAIEARRQRKAATSNQVVPESVATDKPARTRLRKKREG
jgi:predicted transcriptional regulator